MLSALLTKSDNQINITNEKIKENFFYKLLIENILNNHNQSDVFSEAVDSPNFKYVNPGVFLRQIGCV